MYFCTILVVTLLSSKMAHSSIDKGTQMLYILMIDKKEDTGNGSGERDQERAGQSKAHRNG